MFLYNLLLEFDRSKFPKIQTLHSHFFHFNRLFVVAWCRIDLLRPRIMKSSLIFSLQIRSLISVNRIWMIVVCILIGSACEMPNSKEIQQKRLALNSKDETKRLQAIYELGQMRKKAKIATQDLINIMNNETEFFTPTAHFWLASNNYFRITIFLVYEREENDSPCIRGSVQILSLSLGSAIT